MFIFPDAAAEGDSKEESDKANRCEEEEKEEKEEEKSEKEESGEEEAEKEKSGEEESGEEEEEKKTKESEQGDFLIYNIQSLIDSIWKPVFYSLWNTALFVPGFSPQLVFIP